MTLFVQLSQIKSLRILIKFHFNYNSCLLRVKDMKNLRYKKIFFLSAVSFFAVFPIPVFAYIDPASGSAIVSAIIGIFVALWMSIKSYWYKFKSFFNKRK